MIVVVMLIIFICITIVSFVIGILADKRLKQNKEQWFSTHNENEQKIVEDYLTFLQDKSNNRKAKKERN